MSTAARVPPADRFWARLEKFQCACPGCGEVIAVRGSTHIKEAKAVAARPINHRVWNPVLQRLRCPVCHCAFVAGLLLYPLPGRHPIDPPPDVVRTRLERDVALRTRLERQEARRIAGGWCAEASYTNGSPVNLHVTAGCSCPARGWASDCPLHGQVPTAAEGP
jgi:hypothetical protein